jgi:pyridoxamine 5'-phosphate oxidase
MVAGFRIVYLCLTTTTVNGLRWTTRTQPPIAFALSSCFPKSFRSNFHTSVTQTRLMSSNDKNIDTESVGKSDIGAATQDADPPADTAMNRSWRSLLEVSSNKSRKTRGSNYVQLATFDPEANQPKCRTVVFRGFQKLPPDHKYASELDGKSCVMKMITDIRSHKVKQVEASEDSAAEMVWWFSKTSEQYRVQGKLLFVGGGNFLDDGDRELAIARKEIWGNMSDSAREGFFDEHTPGEPYSGDKKTDLPSGGRDTDGNLLPPPDNFLLMLLIPNEVDYLRLTNMYRQADRLGEDRWSFERVNP